MSNEQLHLLKTEQVNPDTVALDRADEVTFLRMMSKANEEAAQAVREAEGELAAALQEICKRMNNGGRLVYCGAGTSGRLGVLDASECPPTFGVSNDLVVGVMAGGDRALRFSSESAEDHAEYGEEDMKKISLNEKDALVAIAASGRTPYCLGALRYAKQVGAAAIALVCNENTRMAEEAQLAITLKTGPEVLTGSTRMKAGTATKMALNALSTGAMVSLGKTYQNFMVDMKATNEKLKNRAVRMFLAATDTDDEQRAKMLLEQAQGNVKTAVVMALASCDAAQAHQALNACGGHARKAIEQIKG